MEQSIYYVLGIYMSTLRRNLVKPTMLLRDLMIVAAKEIYYEAFEDKMAKFEYNHVHQDYKNFEYLRVNRIIVLMFLLNRIMLLLNRVFDSFL